MVNMFRGSCLGISAWCWRFLKKLTNGCLVSNHKEVISRYRFGQQAERLAARFLLRRGYSILGQRVDHGFGEMDIVAVDHRVNPAELVVLEVKALRRVVTRLPEASVGARKLARLRQAVTDYIGRHHLRQVNYRIDVIAVHWPRAALLPGVRHLKARDRSGISG